MICFIFYVIWVKFYGVPITRWKEHAVEWGLSSSRNRFNCELFSFESFLHNYSALVKVSEENILGIILINWEKARASTASELTTKHIEAKYSTACVLTLTRLRDQWRKLLLKFIGISKSLNYFINSVNTYNRDLNHEVWQGFLNKLWVLWPHFYVVIA